MIKTQGPLLTSTLAIWLSLGGCASQAPTIAHTHIGHTMDGWPDTPDQAGLFITAENAAEASVQSAQIATTPDAGLAGIKRATAQVIRHTNPEYGLGPTNPEKKEYGVKNALAEAAQHIVFAAQSGDATANVRSSAQQFSDHAAYVLSRCDLITALGDEVLNSSTTENARLLAEELVRLTRANRDGEDTDGDGVAGSAPEEYGMKQLRTELQAMIDREDPPYTTVDSWYLFNLVRLPSGEWIFRKLGIGSDDQGSGY